jgi:hypothetical protein
MADDRVYTIAQEIADVSVGAPHVVLLGAGASVAAFPHGDRNGRRLPVMSNFVQVLGLEVTLGKYGISYSPGDNFEDVYSSLYGSSLPAANELNSIVLDYFSRLELPDQPTLYDHLVLSLREKDLIATYNWDPFLYQACARNHEAAKMPKVAYLHGSVAIGFCEKDRRIGKNDTSCSICGEKFTPTQLLYPILEKNYNADLFVKAQWDSLKAHMKRAMIFSIFGYSAPKSDVEAIRLMKEGWGDVHQREMEQTEVIDIRPEDELVQNWNPFIHSHHYEVHDTFYESWISKHPRRTCEAAFQQFYEAKFIDQNPVPAGVGFDHLYRWVSTLTDFEQA